MADDLPRDWWAIADVARYLGVAESTVRSYNTRGQMPEPDRRIGTVSVWRPVTIQKWNVRRPRKGGTSSTGKA